jgi:uncharacterized membrane protein HdeD (DUF308 family)
MSEMARHRVEGLTGVESELIGRVQEQTARHWKLLLAIGVLCDIAGVYSIFVPIVASISASVLVGWALLFAGIVQLAHMLRRERSWSWDVAWGLLVSLLTIVAGAWIVISPLTGTITLTVVLVAWFWAVGVARLLAWWRIRHMRGSWTIGLNGAASLILGILIWAELPDSAAWAIGLLVGIDLVFAGSSLIMSAITGRQLARMR